MVTKRLLDYPITLAEETLISEWSVEQGVAP